MPTAALLSLLAAGRIAGVVEYAGKPLPVVLLSRSSDAECKVDIVDPTVVLSKAGKALANVVVHIVDGAPVAAPPVEPIAVTQRDCMYVPRVQGAVKGQRLVVKNADGTMHNVHAYVGTDDKKTLFNVAQPPGSRDVNKDSKGTVGVVKMKCDVHPWMRAYVLFSDSAFFATTDAEGRFEINDVPPGRYTVEAWHEKFGTQRAELLVEEGKASDPKLAFSR